MKFSKLSALLVLVLVFFSCSKNRFKIDTEDVNLTMPIERFDKDLLSLDTSNINQSISQLEKKYPDFFSYYFSQVFRFGSSDSAGFSLQVSHLLSDSMFQEVCKESQLVFADVSDIQKETTDAFKYIHFYFPKKKLPKLAMHISGFNQSKVRTKDYISVRIDNYLGADYTPYKTIVYDYQLQNMTRSKVAPDIVLGYLMSEFPFDNNTQLLAGILTRGKVLYLQSICMPQRTEADLMGYTPAQFDWCVANEKNMWTAIIENKHLYNTSQIICAKYLNPAPFTSYFTEESPGQAGIWLGLQIVKSYMESNHDITLPELMEQNDFQLMLENSNYRP